MKTRDFARRVPKAELHLHVEGTLEPELLFALAERNGVALRWPTVEALRAAYDFTDLQSFLDLYYEGASVLRTGQDFHDLATAYFDRAAADGVRHVELFFDPQTHTARGVAMGTVIEGLASAAREACGRHDLTVGLIPCFLRHLSAREAMATLEEALPWRELLLGVGLDSSEAGHPPSKFVDVFDRARELGLRPVAHAGEEGPAEYVREALDLLRARRIDHGVRCLEDAGLVERLRRERVPLTVCPLSNVKLRVTPRLEDHPIGALLERGLLVTINSDDPAYFGGYVGENFARTAEALGLGIPELRRLARNSFEASFLPLEEKLRRIAEVEGFEPEAG